MRRPSWLRLSLSRKLSLLFGVAVLLTIVATLTFPWQQMTALMEQAMLLRAQLVARAERVVQFDPLPACIRFALELDCSLH